MPIDSLYLLNGSDDPRPITLPPSEAGNTIKLISACGSKDTHNFFTLTGFVLFSDNSLYYLNNSNFSLIHDFGVDQQCNFLTGGQCLNPLNGNHVAKGYIVVDNSVYFLSGTSAPALISATIDGQITMISGGGSLGPGPIGSKSYGYLATSNNELYHLADSSISQITIPVDIPGTIKYLSGGGGFYGLFYGHGSGYIAFLDNGSCSVYSIRNNTIITTALFSDSDVTFLVGGGIGSLYDNSSQTYFGIPSGYAVVNNTVYYLQDTTTTIVNLPTNKQISGLTTGYATNWSNTSPSATGYVSCTDDTLYYLSGSTATQIDNVPDPDPQTNGNIKYIVGGSYESGAGYLVTTTACVHPDTTIKKYCNDGTIMQVPISSIKAGDTVVNYLGEPEEVISNIRFMPKSEFVKFCPNSLNVGMPYSDLYITDNHPILLNGTEVLPRTLLKMEMI